MKKYLLLLVLFFGCSSKDENILYVYNWSDYIDKTILADFEKETGTKIIYDTFSSNEELLAKLQSGSGGYDVIFPSDYMVTIMVKDSMVEELNLANIPNLKNINKLFLNPSYDPEQKYSIPYTSGLTGIAYRTDLVDEKIDSWKIFWNSKYKNNTMLLNDMREVYAMAFKILGYSVNDTNLEHLKEAHKLLLDQKKYLKKYESDMSKDFLLTKEVSIIQQWVGDTYQIMEQDSNIAFEIPKEGAIKFTDNICIPKGAKHKDAAEKFINYLLRPDIAARIINVIWYSMPNDAAMPMVNDEIKNDKNIFPDDAVLKKYEFVVDLGEYTAVMEKYWTELKSY